MEKNVGDKSSNTVYAKNDRTRLSYTWTYKSMIIAILFLLIGLSTGINLGALDDCTKHTPQGMQDSNDSIRTFKADVYTYGPTINIYLNINFVGSHRKSFDGGGIMKNEDYIFNANDEISMGETHCNKTMEIFGDVSITDQDYNKDTQVR